MSQTRAAYQACVHREGALKKGCAALLGTQPSLKSPSKQATLWPTPSPVPPAAGPQVSWVQPRILTVPQVAALAARLDGWVDKVSLAAITLQEESVGVVEAGTTA
jgi:hypothetical protein